MAEQVAKPLEALGTAVVYDGECPFCSSYVGFLRLRETLGQDIALLNAREPHPIVAYARGQGFDLDNEMLLVYRGTIYSGADCLRIIALMTTSSRLFNRFNAVVFRNKAVARFLYPIMRFGRNTTLAAFGRRRIDGAPIFRRPAAKRSSYWTSRRAYPLIASLMLAGYAVMSHAHKFFPQTRQSVEIFPFFNWSLFSRPTTVVSTWILDYSKNQSLLGTDSSQQGYLRSEDSPLQHDIVFLKAVVRFGELYSRGQADSVQFRNAKRAVDQLLAAYDARDYFLVKNTYDPIVRYRTKQSLQRERVAHFIVESVPRNPFD